MADNYTFLDANGVRWENGRGKVTTSTIQVSPSPVQHATINPLGTPSLKKSKKVIGKAVMKKKLKPLDEWNQEVQILRRPKQRKGNGLACPSCGAELFDSTPGQSMSDCMGFSTTTPVHCGNQECSFRSFREC